MVIFCNFVLEYFVRNRKFENKINIFHINLDLNTLVSKKKFK